ncbi:hypothetical protein MAIT1_00722 [Magnetofaba australis IT-1]|uniref:Uncharacterized protein n=1 Tax=Magnetofaba australis IT-1 TaxID=1434232 RepID=A0A1Y2JZB4_9PROT|nr:hypothetical protein MAIT1_00722 [Magnetofaba australis IT-1]
MGRGGVAIGASLAAGDGAAGLRQAQIAYLLRSIEPSRVERIAPPPGDLRLQFRQRHGKDSFIYKNRLSGVERTGSLDCARYFKLRTKLQNAHKAANLTRVQGNHFPAGSRAEPSWVQGNALAG